MTQLHTVTLSHRTSRPGWWWCEPCDWTPADPGLAPADCTDLADGTIWDPSGEGEIAGLAVYAPDATGEANCGANATVDSALADLAWLQTGTCDLRKLADVAGRLSPTRDPEAVLAVEAEVSERENAATAEALGDEAERYNHDPD